MLLVASIVGYEINVQNKVLDKLPKQLRVHMKRIGREIELNFIPSFQTDSFKIFFRDIHDHFFSLQTESNPHHRAEKIDHLRFNFNSIGR